MFLNYSATHPNSILTYTAIDMILIVHCDAYYLSEPKAISQSGGHFFLEGDTRNPTNNGYVLNIYQTIKAVMTSFSEAELGELFINAQDAVPQSKTLEEMGQPQTPEPIQTDNYTKLVVVTNNIQPRHTKAMDMIFHCIPDRETQKKSDSI